jgi:peptidoglycan/xylan/chitin deacetylase (PgdA/CDA1 family)
LRSSQEKKIDEGRRCRKGDLGYKTDLPSQRFCQAGRKKQMKVRNLVSSLARKFISQKFFSSLRHVLWQNGSFCLMLHRVADQNPARLKANENMKVSPDYLESFILDSKAKGYAFISLNELTEAMEERRFPSRSIILTLDDGYRDNIIHGLPLFRKHQIPFTVYLSTFFIESRELPWWYLLEKLLLEKSQIIWSGDIYDVTSTSSKERLFMKLRQIILEDFEGSASGINFLCRENEFSTKPEEDLFLSWADIVELATEPLADVGNHGHSHLNLIRASDATVQKEFSAANELIYSHTGRYPRHYCFPYGLYDSRALDVLRNSGAVTCATSAGGAIQKSSSTDLLFELPRFMLTEGMYIDDLLSDMTYLYFRNRILRKS